MRALVTGVDGFVAPFLRSALECAGLEVHGTCLHEEFLGPSTHKMDVTDAREVADVIATVRPRLVFHLAGFSSVAESFQHPDVCRRVNVQGTANLLSAIVQAGLHPRVLVVSSAEVYGKPESLPMSEDHPLSPSSPYASSRVEQEQACMAMARENGLDIVISRSFNHAGPGQKEMFVLSSLARQVAMIEHGADPIIRVGNMDAIRDFSDVRDVVEAYRLLLDRYHGTSPVNVCSGHARSIKSYLDELLSLSGVLVEVQQDPARMRPSDIPILSGSNSLLRSSTGWVPRFDVRDTLRDMLAWWREKLDA